MYAFSFALYYGRVPMRQTIEQYVIRQGGFILREKILNETGNILLILSGNLIYALAVAMFILPCNLITGGTTGLALVLNRQFHVPVSGFVLVFNVVMFIIGAFVLGKKFALTTLISTFFYPVILEALQHINGLSDFTSNPLLAAIFAGLMIGAAIGIVIRAGASTGGMDIPPLVLNKKLGWPVSAALYVLDFLVLLFQMLFSGKEQVLYGILLVLIYTVTLDKVLLMGDSKTQVKIVSKKYKEITSMIIHELDRGATLLEAETGFYRSGTKVVLTVISNRELPRLNQMVSNTDPKAFMIINQVNEVKGRGFTLDKVHHKAR